MVSLIVIMTFIGFYSDPIKIGEIYKKAYLTTDLGGNDNSKFHNPIVFHRFIDEDSNIYNVRCLEHEGKPTLKYGDSVVLNYKIMQGRLLKPKIDTYYVDYNKISR